MFDYSFLTINYILPAQIMKLYHFDVCASFLGLRDNLVSSSPQTEVIG